jgi:hypothetical protein
MVCADEKAPSLPQDRPWEGHGKMTRRILESGAMSMDEMPRALFQVSMPLVLKDAIRKAAESRSRLPIPCATLPKLAD